MTPTFSLGCGTWGGSNTTDNINYRNLLNIKTVSHRQAPPQWFRVPSDTYFNAGAIENLRGVSVEKILLVTDADTEFRGVPETLRAHLGGAAVHTFSDIHPEPTEEQIRAGVDAISQFEPEAILAVGGGSVLDAAKAMRLFHESPELTMRELSLPLPRCPQAGHPVPRPGAQDPTDRGADDGRDRLGGLSGGGRHRGRTEGHPGRLLARPRRRDRRSAPHRDDAGR